MTFSSADKLMLGVSLAVLVFSLYQLYTPDSYMNSGEWNELMIGALTIITYTYIIFAFGWFGQVVVKRQFERLLLLIPTVLLTLYFLEPVARYALLQGM